MPRFHCTKKLLAHLGVPVSPQADLEQAYTHAEPRLGDWYANLIRLENRNAVLYTNERTLFSFLVFGIRAKTPGLLPSGFIKGLAAALAFEGHGEAEVGAILSEYEGVVCFTTAPNQKVLGSMTAIVQDLEHIIRHKGGLPFTDLDDVVHRFNNTPWSAIGYRHPSELVRELTAAGARRQ